VSRISITPRIPRHGPPNSGPTLRPIAKAAAKSERMLRTNDNWTARRLGYEPMSFDDGLRLLISGCVDSAGSIRWPPDSLETRSCNRGDRRTARFGSARGDLADRILEALGGSMLRRAHASCVV